MYVLELKGQHDEFAACEASAGAHDVTKLAPGLVTARSLFDNVQELAFTRCVSELLGTCNPTIDDARALLDASRIDRRGTVAVRAVDVRGTTGVDTQAVERTLGDSLVEHGFDVDLDDPDHELRALFSTGGDGGVCALGWLVVETVADFERRKPGNRPFFQPGGMDPQLARALVNIAGAGSGRTVLDPMCGTGGFLIEAGLVGARVVGLDAQQKMVRGSKENLGTYLDGEWDIVRGDASNLPLVDESVDAVVFDTPYGRQSRIEGELYELVAGTLAESHRVASAAVVVGDQPWTEPAEDAGWRVQAQFSRRVHRSLTRHILVLE